EIYEAFDTHSQIEGARQVLSSLDDLEDTCVVLPQASCLMPLLYQAIPADLSNYNISLGYPLKHTPIYALIDMIMQAQERKRQDNSFYTKDYLKVIMHPYIKNIGDEGFSRDVMRMMIHKIEEALLGIDKTIGIAKKPFIRLPEIEENSLIFQAAAGLISKSGIAAIQPKDLRSQLRLVHQKIFSAFDNCTRLIDFVKSTQEVLYFILAKSKAGLDIFSSEVFGRFLDTLDSLGYSLCKDEPIKNKATFFELLKIYLSSENIPFAGTPLRGLQILGLLETRNLKFSNLLILDLNEGILPKTDKGESFIPEGIFPLLGLTHYHKREQIMRYHFRRLIGSAKNASLFFKTCSHNNQSRSRFIEEIIWQEEKSSQRLYDQKKIKRIEFKIKPTKESFRLKKTPQTLKLIREIVFSPTSLDTYLNCPARFYFHYCLGLTEKEDIFDELEASDIGNFLHSLLEDFYSLFLNKTVKIDERAQQYLFQLKENKYKQFFPSDTAEQFLLSKIIDYKLKAFLNQEAKRKEKIKILCLEQILPVDSQKISINTEYGRVCLRGKLDRVDERILGGRRRIVILDYKTGKYNLPKRITHKMSLTSRQEIKRGIVSFQLPLYIYLFSQAKRISPHSGIEASFYSLRDIKEEFLFGDKDAGNLFAIYLDAAKRIFSEILCPNFDILRDDTDEQYCRWCPFPALCKR
ncbi:MAG: PD-(D/E)XK nuclease family protein, partial [Candidatus Omnitrophota bacterium]